MLYFDHNATTFVAPEVMDVLSRGLRETFGNASSVHREGQAARLELESARRKIAEFAGAIATELVFTGSGTESNNLAIFGVVRNRPSQEAHVVTTSIEHPSVMEPCRQLEREGVQVTYVPVESTGVIDADRVARALRRETVLVSVMHANNEVGTIQPVQEIAAVVQKRRAEGQPIFLHSDGVQSFGKIDIHLRNLGVDLYSMSAHKLFGPKGIAGLFVRKGTALYPTLFGGRQERERRPGTENVPGAMAFARAVELCGGESDLAVRDLRDRFEREVKSGLENVEINGDLTQRLPNTSNLLIPGVPAEALLIALDMQGICVSTGSACSSGSLEPSPVLLAMGRTTDEARSSVRVSFGRYNTLEQVDVLVAALVSSAKRLSNTSRLERAVVV